MVNIKLSLQNYCLLLGRCKRLEPKGVSARAEAHFSALMAVPVRRETQSDKRLTA